VIPAQVLTLTLLTATVLATGRAWPLLAVGVWWLVFGNARTRHRRAPSPPTAVGQLTEGPERSDA
jgi:hypothetical protein